MEKQNSQKAKGDSKFEKALTYIMEHPGRVLVGGTVIGIGSYFLFNTIKKFIKKAQQSDTEKKLDDSPSVRQATVLHNAMNPSGLSWMKNYDGTNESKIFDTARNITNLDEVLSAYKKLYDSDLLEDLQSELDTDDFQKFLTLISANPDKKGTPPVNFAKKNQMIVAKKEVFLRKTPDASYHGAWYESSSGNNILSQAKPGDFIGYATGKQEFDAKNNVKFIQVGYLVKKDGLPDVFKSYAGKSFTVWVSASKDYIDTYDNFKPMFEQYPNLKTIVAYKKPLDFYDKTVKGISVQTVISIAQTDVLDENMKPYCTVEKFVLLGQYIGYLDTPNTKFIKFLTVDNTERWADSKTIKIIKQ